MSVEIEVVCVDGSHDWRPGAVIEERRDDGWALIEWKELRFWAAPDEWREPKASQDQ